MDIQKLKKQILLKRSFLCVGLDVDLKKIPKSFLELEDPIYEFSIRVIESTVKYAVAYKPNIAFFERYGPKGMKSLNKIIEFINNKYPNLFTIADAKRGDIGNTSSRYAKAFFETYNFDSITVVPYMGKDSIEPFLRYKNKYAILLALTSNQGAKDFQFITKDQTPLYEEVIKASLKWKNSNRLMYVVGATRAESIERIRKLIPDSFLLIPGLGFQGGNLHEVSKYALNKDVGILVNSSRGIIYSFKKEKTMEKDLSRSARKIQEQMSGILQKNNFL
ncbi:MAG: orotidine-5'-phosphate decarboxylase [Flavobacteriaceae bacterium]|nr:orotidine-5'-phosphate decarboxylase [Flavobacteriaceae bacterium]